MKRNTRLEAVVLGAGRNVMEKAIIDALGRNCPHMGSEGAPEFFFTPSNGLLGIVIRRRDSEYRYYYSVTDIYDIIRDLDMPDFNDIFCALPTIPERDCEGNPV